MMKARPTLALLASTLALAVAACGGGGDSAGDAGPRPDDGATSDDAVVIDAGPTPDVGPPPAQSPVEPVWPPDEVGARVKSPGQRMRFTAGLPFRILADGNDPSAWECPPGHPPYVCPDSAMTFFVDGQPVGTVPPDPDNQNLWELRLPNGLPAGDHVITVRFAPHDAPAVDGLVPVYIHVDPVPTYAHTLDLSADLVLGGNTTLDWTNTLVRGHGFEVRTAPGYTGAIRIRDSMVTGLAAFDHQVGLDVTTTGAVEISNTIFEATAPLRLVVNGSAPITIRDNELRATNYVTYVSSDPSRSPILDLAGNTSGAKVMQGNNIGGGIVRISEMAGWQIGGLRDSEGNIFNGPRCVLALDDADDAVIQGNYLRHDYYGGFSQGFNLHFSGGTDGALVEHNVIRDSSWPVQSFGGELRYNLLVNSGHDFVRSARSQARFHHNILAHAQAPNSGYDGAVLLYGGEQGVVFDSNTFDAGGAVGSYGAPAIVLGSPGVGLASLRNNVFTQFDGTHALIAGADGESSVGSPRVAEADYNAWHNPLAGGTARYLPGLVAGTAGAHDVVADPDFAGDVPQVPYLIDEGMVWTRSYGVSQVLAHYRALYTPSTGSPLIDAGDPADGAATDIGAVGAGTNDPDDKLGRTMTPN
jgi:hypothetical protein